MSGQRITTVVGARPQFIKAASVSNTIAEQRAAGASIDEQLIHTGQHYDYEMSAVFFQELGLPDPAHHLEVGSGSHGAQTGLMMERLESVLAADPPDVVVVYGDTNTTLAAALVAAKLHVPVAHVEAGLRSYRRGMAEEVNRVVTDHVSDLLFCPSEASAGNLDREGIIDGVEITGDVMLDILSWWVADMDRDRDAPQRFDVDAGAYAVATIHRAENTDRPEHLEAIVKALERVGDAGLPVVLPLHPRARARVEGWGGTSSVRVVDPVPYREMASLVAHADVVLTDSGGVQKEAYWLGVPCVTMRDETEWIETVDAGWNVVTGADPDRIVEAALDAGEVRCQNRPPLYGTGNAADVIVDTLVRRFG